MRVFISYRRSDDRHLAGRLQDRLADAFGDDNVFYDVDSIPVGADFREVIRSTLQTVDVVLALVGPGWSSERLTQPNDVVRLELAMAFDLAKPVIPVLVDDAAMPAPSSLPPELERLAHLHAAPLRPDPGFHPDTQRLIDAITSLAESARPRDPLRESAPRTGLLRSHEPEDLPATRSAAGQSRSWTFGQRTEGRRLSLAFSPVGTLLTSAGDARPGRTGAVRLWELEG